MSALRLVYRRGTLDEQRQFVHLDRSRIVRHPLTSCGYLCRLPRSLRWHKNRIRVPSRKAILRNHGPWLGAQCSGRAWPGLRTALFDVEGLQCPHTRNGTASAIVASMAKGLPSGNQCPNCSSSGFWRLVCRTRSHSGHVVPQDTLTSPLATRQGMGLRKNAQPPSQPRAAATRCALRDNRWPLIVAAPAANSTLGGLK